jgi:hypothetical protein
MSSVYCAAFSVLLAVRLKGYFETAFALRNIVDDKVGCGCEYSL